jgi:hypothetical protein
MPKGKIGGFHLNTGQVLSEGNVYNFHINNVQGGIQNQQEIEFELDDEGNVKVIFGTGAQKPTKAPVQTKKENSSKKSTQVFLTEEK